MRISHHRREGPDINLTPLIDVVFLLLIFFMVSTTFQRDSELSIELPEASTRPEQAPPRSIDVSIDAQGRFYVDGRELVNTQLGTLKRALEQSAAGKDSPPVVVSADAKTPHQAVVAVMDAARQLGLLKLTFAARLTDAEE